MGWVSDAAVLFHRLKQQGERTFNWMQKFAIVREDLKQRAGAFNDELSTKYVFVVASSCSTLQILAYRYRILTVTSYCSLQVHNASCFNRVLAAEAHYCQYGSRLA
ncbi:hypothetical protein QTP88_025840 [Uroleucon formosanum]